MSPPFIQFYVADYLADTQHFTTEQHGAYLLILFAMWRTADGKLPDDGPTLARIARLSPSRWAKIGSDVMFKMIREGGFITHKRLKAEFEKAQEKSIKRSEAGRAGGKAKALKDNTLPLANATVLPQHSSDIRYQKEESKKKVSPSKPSLQPSLLADASENVGRPKAEFQEFYSAYPRKVGRSEAERAYGKARKGGAAAETLLAGARRYAQERAGEEARYTAHPATWLNQGRWMDEGGTGGALGQNGRHGPSQAVSTQQWVRRVEIFHFGEPGDDLVGPVEPSHWDPKWGPRPGQPGCRVPADALAEYGRLHPPRLAAG